MAPPLQFANPDGGILTVEPADPFESIFPYDANVAMSWYSTFDGNRHAYPSLVSTGAFRLIEDRDLETAIQRYYARVDEVRDFEVVLRNKIDQVRGIADNLGIGNSADITFEELVLLVRNYPALAGALNSQWTSDDEHRGSISSLIQEASNLILALESRP